MSVVIGILALLALTGQCYGKLDFEEARSWKNDIAAELDDTEALNFEGKTITCV